MSGHLRGELIQTAFVVEEIGAAMRDTGAALGCGPWFLRERGVFAKQNYRGVTVQTELSIAMAYGGRMLIELIQQHDDSASVYRDIVARRGFGLHHFGMATRDYDGLCAVYRSAEFERVYRAEVAHGARVAYFEKQDLPYMVEIIEMLPQSIAMFSAMQVAHQEWDGTFQVNALAPLPGRQ